MNLSSSSRGSESSLLRPDLFLRGLVVAFSGIIGGFARGVANCNGVFHAVFLGEVFYELNPWIGHFSVILFHEIFFSCDV